MLELLNKANTYCEEIPPVQNEKSRFGNPAFKVFYSRIANVINIILIDLLKFFQLAIISFRYLTNL